MPALEGLILQWLYQEGTINYKIQKEIIRDKSSTDLIKTYNTYVEKNIIPKNVKNFKSLPAKAKIMFLSAAEVLYKKELNEKFKRTAVIDANISGSLEENFKYFNDYIKNGRKLGRAKLFVRTLSTSFASEIGIYYGFTGEIFYFCCDENNIEKHAFEQAELLLNLKRADSVLLFIAYGQKLKTLFYTMDGG